jgi:hypothetical protein
MARPTCQLGTPTDHQHTLGALVRSPTAGPLPQSQLGSNAARQHPRDFPLDAHTPSIGDSDEPRSSLTPTAPCSPACAATRPGQGDANGQQYGPGGPASAGSGRPHNRRRSGRRQQAATPDSQPRLSGQARGRASAHPQSPTSKTSCGPRRAGPTTCYPEVPSPIRPLSRSRQRGREFPEPHGIPTTRRLGRRVTHRYLLSNPYAAEVAAVPPRAGPDSRGYFQSGRDPSRRPRHNSRADTTRRESPSGTRSTLHLSTIR